MLRQIAWSDAATAAFAAAYSDDPTQAETHREDVAAGRELLMECAHGFITIRLEPRGICVVTGAAGDQGGFAPVLAALEAFFPCVCVETYREGLVKMLKATGYAVDHVRLFKRVQ